LGPTAGERQPAVIAAAPAQIAQHADGEARRGAIEARSTSEERPELQPSAVALRSKPLLELALPPMPHHARQRDLHRTDGFAPPAECGRVGKMSGLVDPDEHG